MFLQHNVYSDVISIYSTFIVDSDLQLHSIVLPVIEIIRMIKNSSSSIILSSLQEPKISKIKQKN